MGNRYKTFEEEFGFSQDFGIEESSPVEIPEEDDRWEVTKGLSAGIDQVQAIGGGLAGVFGDLIGSDSLRDWGLESYSKNMEEAQQSSARIASYEQVESVGDAFDYVMFGLGNALPMFAPSIVSGGVGAIAARKAAQIAVRKLVDKKVKEGIATGLTEAAAAKLAAKEGQKAFLKGQMGGAAVGSVGLETGSIYGEVFEETGERRAGVALTFGTAAGLLDALPIGAALNRMGMKNAKDQIIGLTLDGAGTFLGKQVLKEATTEGLQTIIERSAIKWVDENKDVFTEDGWSEIKNAALLGGIAGGVFSAPTAPYNRKKLNDEANEKKRQVDNDQDILKETDKSFEEVIGGDLAMPSLDELNNNSLDQELSELIDTPESQDTTNLEAMLKADLEEYNSLKSWDTDGEFLDKSDKEKQAKAIELKNRIIANNGELERLQNPDDFIQDTTGFYEESNQSIADFENQRNANIDLQEKKEAENNISRRRDLAKKTVEVSEDNNSDGVSFGEVTLATAIRNSGGINIEEAESDGLDPSDRRALNNDTDYVGKPFFSVKGKSLDGMREELSQWGWDEDSIEPARIVNNAIESVDQTIGSHELSINWRQLRELILDETGKTFTKNQLQSILTDYGNGKKLTPKQELAANYMLDYQQEILSDFIEQGVLNAEPDDTHSEDFADWYREEHQNVYNLIRKVATENPELASEIMAEWEQHKTTDGEVTRFINNFLEAKTNETENKSERKPVQADSRQSDQGRKEGEPSKQNAEFSKLTKEENRLKKLVSIARENRDDGNDENKNESEMDALYDAYDKARDNLKKAEAETLNHVKNRNNQPTNLEGDQDAQSNARKRDREEIPRTVRGKIDAGELDSKEVQGTESRRDEVKRNESKAKRRAKFGLPTTENDDSPRIDPAEDNPSDLLSPENLHRSKGEITKEADDYVLRLRNGDFAPENTENAQRDAFLLSRLKLTDDQRNTLYGHKNSVISMAYRHGLNSKNTDLPKRLSKTEIAEAIDTLSGAFIPKDYKPVFQKSKIKYPNKKVNDVNDKSSVKNLAVMPNAKKADETHSTEEIKQLASETNTDPSVAQIEAGNYKKGRVKIHGLNIAIENPKGSTRSGTDPNGKAWSVTMKHHYGDISRTEGADGDAVDVFIGEKPESEKVFVIDQVKANGHFDEHKVMLGFNTQTSAVLGYKANYSKGWKVGKVTEMAIGEFKDWLKNGDTTKKVQGSEIGQYSAIHKGVTLLHGSDAKFSKFDESRLGSVWSQFDYGKGYYFTTDKSKADMYAKRASDKSGKKPHILEFESTAKKPYVIDYDKAVKNGSVQPFWDGIPENLSEIDDATDWLKEQGYDSVSVIKNSKLWEHVVFDLKNIKPKKKTVKQTTNKPAIKVSKNTIFTEDTVEKARALLRSKLSQLNSGIDPEILQAGIILTIDHIEKGARTFAAYSKAMVADMGDMVKPYLKSWYMAAKFDPSSNELTGMSDTSIVESANIETILKEESTNESSQSNDLESNIKGTDKEPLGAKSDENESNSSDENARSASEPPRKSGSKQQGDSGLSVDGDIASGEFSNTDILGQTGEYGSVGGTSKLANSARSGSSGDFRVKPKSKPARRADTDASTADLTFKEKVKKQQAINATPNFGDKDDIVATLPVLLDHQQEDVFKAEKRFFNADGAGMMFTNGTGTGKTFVGLGIAKRFELNGQKQGLFLAPTDKKVKDWIEDGEHLGLKISQLGGIDSSGSDMVVTTYANFGQNTRLLDREFDFVIADESHYFSRNQKGDGTEPLSMLRALTNHPQGLYKKALHKYADDFSAIDKLEKEYVRTNMSLHDTMASAERAAKDEYESDRMELYAKVDAHKATLGKLDTKVVFLSATPFAYVQSADYANGYLFDYDDKKDQQGGYNQANARQDFYIVNFGYRMKTGKLNKPEAGVDSGLMERRFHHKLVDEGVLSGRKLELDKDYSRDFVIVNDSIGSKIDEGMAFLSDSKIDSLEDDGSPKLGYDGEPSKENKYPELSEALNDKFDYLARRKLLESVKAKHAVARIKKHLALGRQVIIFHDYNIGGAVHPFKFDEIIPGAAEFAAERPDLVNLDLSGLIPSIDTIKRAFPGEVEFFNGKVSKKNRSEAVRRFNDPKSSLKILMLQADAGREGISLHDTLGTENGGKQRVLINLGMPTKPVDSTQIEGRGYRFGLKSNFPIEYMTTGARFEEWTFGNTISSRASTAEHLAMGDEARDLARAFKEGYLDASDFEPHADQGVGGKEKDRANFDSDPFTVAISDYYTNEKRTAKNKGQDGNDYFATPEPLGYKIVEWLNLQPNDRFLEPSAGHGAIARYAPEDVVRTFVEPSYTLQPKLRLNAGDGKIVESNFEDFNTINKFEGIAMNPPFGKGGKLAMEHIDKASKHLTNGGRIIAIVPRGAMDKRLDKWLEENKDMHLVAGYPMPTSTFGRAGTNVSTQVIFLDKIIVGKDSKYSVDDLKPTNNRHHPIDNGLSIPELFEQLKDMRGPSRIDRDMLAEANEKTESLKPYVAPNSELFTLADFKDSRDDSPLFAAQVVPSLGDSYKSVSSLARSEGGRYSRYANKATGAIRGFLFTSKESRDNFIQKTTDFMASNGINEGGAVYETNEGYSETGRSIQRDMFVDTSVTKQQLKDIFYVQVKPVPVRELTSSIDHVYETEDVAKLLSDLSNKAQEVMLVVATDESGKVLRVIHHSSGLKAASLADPMTIAAELATIKGATRVYLAHNHPSGTLKASEEDISITHDVDDMMAGLDMRLVGHVIMTPSSSENFGTALAFSSHGLSHEFNFKHSGEKNKRIQVTERVITKNNPRTFISNPAQAKAVLGAIESDNALILLSNANAVVGTVFLNEGEMVNLRAGYSIPRVLAAIDRTNASAAMIKTQSKDAASNMVRFLGRGGSISVLDWMKTDENGLIQSDAQRGGHNLYADGVFYRADTKSKKQVSSSDLDKFSAQVKKDFESSPVSIVDSELDLPIEIRTRISRDGKSGRVKGLFHNGSIFIVGENHENLSDLQKTLLHEAVGHYGLKQLFGDQHSGFIENVYKSITAKEKIGVARRHGLSVNDKTSIAEEYLAEIAETDPSSTLLTKVITWIKDHLRKYFNNLLLSKQEIIELLSKSKQALQKRKAKPLKDVKLAGDRSADVAIRLAIKRREFANKLLRCVNV